MAKVAREVNFECCPIAMGVNVTLLKCPNCAHARTVDRELRCAIYLRSPRFLFGNVFESTFRGFRCEVCGWSGLPKVEDPDVGSKKLCEECSHPIQIERESLYCVGCKLRSELAPEMAAIKLANAACAKCGGRIIVEGNVEHFDPVTGHTRIEWCSIRPQCEHFGHTCDWMHTHRPDIRTAEMGDKST